MSRKMIYQLRLECDNPDCNHIYNLKVPVNEEPPQYQPFKEWKCRMCGIGELIVTDMKKIE
ncbi:MAG: hypothetical protein ACC609_11260 [Methanobacterium formicicum]